MFGAFLAQASAGCLASQGFSFVLWGGTGHLDLSPEHSLANNNDASPVRARHSLAFLMLGLSSITSDRVQATSLGSKVPRKGAGFVTDGKGGAGRAGEHCHRAGTLSRSAELFWLFFSYVKDVQLMGVEGGGGSRANTSLLLSLEGDKPERRSTGPLHSVLGEED